MQGRITETHLPMAEKTFPGIGQMYRDLEVKPATFLQLVWIYEAAREKAATTARRVARRSRRCSTAN